MLTRKNISNNHSLYLQINYSSYLDDIIIGAPTFEFMLNVLRKVLERLKKVNLKLGPTKCKLFKPKITFLGVVLSNNGCEIDPHKVDSIKNMILPANKKQMFTLIGSLNWFRNALANLAELFIPLIETLKKPKFYLTPEAITNIDILKLVF